MNLALGWMKRLPFSLIEGVWVDELIVVALYLCITFFIVLYLTRQLRWGVAFMLVAVLLCINFCWKHFNNLQQTEIQIYSIRKHSLIDIFEGNKIITLRDTTLQLKTENFAAANNRFRKGNMAHIDIKSHQAYAGHSIVLHKNVIYKANTGIAMVSEQSLPAVQPYKYLIISHLGAISLEDILKDYKPQYVIVDGTVSYKKLNAYREILNKLNIPCHSVLEDGAYCIKD
jgi:ABC-type multidrug transport system fused ATPase/permease subunit